MELNDSFEVAHGIDAVWDVLTDVERIAPCLPGAQITGRDGDAFEGLVKVKVGPISSQYKGKASFTERDDDAHRLLMSASGRDTRGAGNASAEITVALEAVSDDATMVSVHTNLTITGKVAQFRPGRAGRRQPQADGAVRRQSRRAGRRRCRLRRDPGRCGLTSRSG